MKIDNELFGVSYDDFNMQSVTDVLLGNDRFCMLVTPNVDHLIRYNRSHRFKEIYLNSDIVLNDSRFLSNICKIFGLKIPPAVPGSDLCRYLLESDSIIDKDITVIGCTEATVLSVREKFKLNNIKHYNPPMGFIDSQSEIDKCVEFIVNSNSHYVFLCVGSPRQEELATICRSKGIKGSFLCVGASLAFLSGEERRAPLFLQTVGFEWLFRLIQSPRRLSNRYLVQGPKFIPIFIKQLIKSYRLSKKLRQE